jgi:hypothetical protein
MSLVYMLKVSALVPTQHLNKYTMCTEFICHMKTGTLQTETLSICGYGGVPCASQVKNPEAKYIGCGLIKYVYI